MGTLTVTNCAITHNESWTDGTGGGVYNTGTLTIRESTVSENRVNSGVQAGGFFNGGKLTVINSTISNNIGAGILANSPSSTLTVVNSTISGNSVGGLLPAGPTSVTNSTIVGNDHAGIGYIGNGTVISVKGTLLVGNQRGNCGGNSFVSQGYNLSDDASCSSLLTAATDKHNTPVGLASTAPQDNGCPTPTIALLPNSPAVDAIPAATCTDTNNNPLTTDQRGITRPQGAACDIGAFELVQNTPFSYFSTKAAILTGKPSGFGVTAWFSLGSTSNGIHPLTEAVTLQIANYSVTIPAGSFHQLWNSPQAPYAYTGTIGGTKLVVGLISLGNNNYQFDIAGSPVAFSTGITNPVTVSLTIGDDTGTGPVTAVISAR
jgi:hypothetical protein